MSAFKEYLSSRYSRVLSLFGRFRRNRWGMFGLFLLILFAVMATVGPYFSPYDPLQIDLSDRLSPPSNHHPLGTDGLGRDILARIIYGSRISITAGLTVIAVALVFGVPLGLIAGFYGGRIDQLISRVIDIFLAFPAVLLAIAVVSALGVGLYNAVLAIGIAETPLFIRIMRGAAISIRENEYIEAARAIGESKAQILYRHVLPNSLAIIIVTVTLRLPMSILMTAGLSFLGLGATPPTPEWGALIADGRDFIVAAPHVSMFPGFALMLLALGFNLFGDGLNDALNPRLKG